MSAADARVDPLKLTGSALWSDDEQLARRLWHAGYRPTPANRVEPGQQVAYVATLFGFAAGMPRPARVIDVLDDGLGTITVAHTSGETEADDGQEIWTRDG